jgi:Nucleotidyl transferase AbiEii toxin, Type IV TA system
MKRIQNYSQSICGRYPTTTGRLKRVIGSEQARPKKVALLGDSTLDNGYWVQRQNQYADKTHTVTHQTAAALANNTKNAHSYDVGNFAVDGATTADLRRQCRLDKVLPSVELTYPSVFTINDNLRPHILFEFTLSNLRCDVVTRSVKTLMEENIPDLILFPDRLTLCVHIHETAIEKWVGLTRRTIAIEQGYHYDDRSLIRQVYDLNAIESAEPIPDEFLMLAKDIVLNDAQQFKNQKPEYAANPAEEINRSLDLLRTKPIWRERYQDFIENMVFNPDLAVDYDKAINVIADLSKRVISDLH